ncbi:DNA cytosine methyltransferase [Pseudomonas peli]|uniref:DNA cytosine methyltransferase n=1 Tax=Pseudomonas peli TaxID=592361 RepID=UPI0028677242|nr:DNA cytosine methyltransferase [Pseudomonas peli]MDR7025937.1 DNA (cytosine-5)-methyltransferase 1 [Pseudomonas peli]
MNIDVYDFFSGCGGTSCGFRDAGFNIKMGLDIDHDSAETFKLNFPEAHFIEADIREIEPSEISSIIRRENPILFSGCAPCQPFSKQNRHQQENDKRLNLLDEFGRFVKHWLPEYVFIENVPGMQVKAAKSKTFSRFTNLLTELGYSYSTDVVEAQWYGVPQKRRRLILIASLRETAVMPAQSHGTNGVPHSTVREWISDLPVLEHGESDPRDSDHFSMRLSEKNLERIKLTPEGGGREHWPERLVLDCHKGYEGHVDVYGRLSWDKPAVGLTTKCISYSNGRFGHPVQNRAISLREAACLQTFPRDFKFIGSKSSRARQVGNAVPPLMARSVGNAIKSKVFK